jgi:hypothetical protein
MRLHRPSSWGRLVGFARADILFFDAQVIDLYHRGCARYRTGEGTRTKEKSHNRLAARRPTA